MAKRNTDTGTPTPAEDEAARAEQAQAEAQRHALVSASELYNYAMAHGAPIEPQATAQGQGE